MNLGKGMFEGVTLLLGDLGPRAVVLLASGARKTALFDQYPLERISEYARAHEIKIYVVSMESGEEGDKAEMREAYKTLAVSTGGRYYAASDETGYKSIYGDIRAEHDHRYLITYKSALSKISERYADVRVQIRSRGTEGTADGGYFVP
ncbi:MAG: hypothetical protein HY042_07510, partial [Spirochaetia bacterium]|nr:hypothetical protein [Spirochaetia bacterium]